MSERHVKEKKSMHANSLPSISQVWAWVPVRVSRVVTGKSDDMQSKEALGPALKSGELKAESWSPQRII